MGVESIVGVKLPAAELRRRRASRRGGPLLRRQPCLGLPLQLRLPARFLGLQLLDLALDPGEHLLALGELALDRLLLARALGHDLGLVLSRRLQALTTLGDLLAERLDVREHLRVLVTDALHHVQPAEQVIEVLGAEQDLDGATLVAVHVQGAEPLGDVRLSGFEALLGHHQVVRVRVQVGVDLGELHVRVVVRLDRLLELDVRLLNLRQHGLGLGALRLDRVRRRGTHAGKKSHYAQQGQ